MLPLNFHQTFVPERRLITALMEYAASGQEGTLYQMSEQTGIPMGKSSGKMPAILNYCKGMGLIAVSRKDDQRIKPTLTPFGNTVYLSDRYLGEELTQWLVHLNLCRRDVGAVLWNRVFGEGTRTLGISFSCPKLEEYLVSHFGRSKKTRTGPLLATYRDDAALARAGILRFENDVITRNKAPIKSTWATAYSALMLEMFEAFFAGQFQVTVTDFAEETLLFDICLWQESDIDSMLSLVQNRGFVSVDRQIWPWVIEKRANSESVWRVIFDSIVS